MVRLKLEVHSLQINKKVGYTQFFCVANDIPIEVKVPDSDMEQHGMAKVKEAVNDQMLNTLRIIKHVGHLDNPKMSDLNKWSSTDTGLAIKPKNDQIKEFPRFK